MNLFEFIVHQQTNFPTECLMAFPIIMGFIATTLIGLWIVMLIHGFPTQKMIYNYTEATRIPERSYLITGKLKEEIAESKLVRQRMRREIQNSIDWWVEHPKHLVIVTMVFVTYILIMGAI